MIRMIESELRKIFHDIEKKLSELDYYFLSERDVQAFIYCRLKNKFKNKFYVHLDPTITNRKKPPYKIKGVVPFELLDLTINKKDNLKFDELKKETQCKRIKFIDKSKCFVIEIKFFRANYKVISRVNGKDIHSDLEKLRDFPNSKLLVIDCGKNHSTFYRTFMNKKKFVLIKKSNQ